ncbi:MAG: Uma2 family endonuclease [Saprospiraceae bacterium]|jgi:Uma2 family endonuclease|nr:Uma2 family endonuclease [Lewinellaceae bacterium]MBP6812909.1 Uma2 family endonuclease [Saprospiraceae bacterium]
MAAITDISQLDLNGTYSYADYLTWKFEQTLELIKGKIFVPMAAPSRRHQQISWRLTLQIGELFKHHRCDAYAAPFDVRLFDKRKSEKANKDIFTVVQPDLCVICDLEKLDDRGCLGAPDFIIEILSPGNSMREMKIKKDLYAENGVREYWIVDFDHETLTRFKLEGEDRYGLAEIFVSNETVVSLVFPDLAIQLEELFLP